MKSEFTGDMSLEDISQNDRIYNELSRINNELINSQRRVVKQNAKLKQLRDELVKGVASNPAKNKETATIVQLTKQEILSVFPALTNREAEILRLLGQRMTPQEIAEMLGVSVRTINVHISHIYKKIKVNSKKGAILRLVEMFQQKGEIPLGNNPWV